MFPTLEHNFPKVLLLFECFHLLPLFITMSMVPLAGLVTTLNFSTEYNFMLVAIVKFLIACISHARDI